jgi:hypothetical protein
MTVKDLRHPVGQSLKTVTISEIAHRQQDLNHCPHLPSQEASPAHSLSRMDHTVAQARQAAKKPGRRGNPYSTKPIRICRIADVDTDA